MCGRFALDQKTDDLIQAFVADGNDFSDWLPRYSIAPTDVTPIIRERRHRDSGEVTRTVDAAVWDFHPAFMRDSKRPQFNARIETVATNGLPLYRHGAVVEVLSLVDNWSRQPQPSGQSIE